MPRRISKAPIYSLPDEIMLLTFNYTIGNRRDYVCKWHRYYRALIKLMLVCKAWYLLIDSNPLFWTVINAGLITIKTMEGLLAKSGTAPLAMSFCKSVASKTYTDLLIQSAGRWRELTILRRATNPSTIDILVAVLERAHQLAEIRLEYVSTPWSLLKNLTVMEIEQAFPARAEDVIEALKSSPRLITLYLSFGNEEPPEDDLHPIELEPIRLLELQSIDLRCGSALTRHLISAIRAPRCEEFNLDIDASFGSPFEAKSSQLFDVSSIGNRLIEAIRVLPTLILELHGNDEHGKWTLSDVHQESENPSLPCTFFLCIKGSSHLETLGWILQKLGLAKATAPLVMRLLKEVGDPGEELDGEQWLRSLAEVPKVTRLDIASELVQYYRKILQALWSLPPTRSWPFPQMQTLVIVMDRLVDDSVIDMLDGILLTFLPWAKDGQQTACSIEVLVFQVEQRPVALNYDVEGVRSVLRKLRKLFCSERAVLFPHDGKVEVGEWLKAGIDTEKTLVED